MNKSVVPIVTLDGPSGVGKGTVCLRVAQHTGWHILDSGSLYRLTALVAARRGLSADTLASAQQIAQLVEIAEKLDVSYRQQGESLCIDLAGEEAGEAIRSETVAALASKIAAIPEVRAALLDRQRAFAQPPGLVADGRDMGSVVFPAAGVKIFMMASAEERANRRYKQLIEKGIGANLAALVAELKARDERDTQRAASPLVAAVDAHLIDTTSMSIDEVAAAVLQHVRRRFGI